MLITTIVEVISIIIMIPDLNSSGRDLSNKYHHTSIKPVIPDRKECPGRQLFNFLWAINGGNLLPLPWTYKLYYMSMPLLKIGKVIHKSVTVWTYNKISPSQANNYNTLYDKFKTQVRNAHIHM